MKEYYLNIGDVATSSNHATYSCLGLGSCIGLFLQDRTTGVTGGAHIFLPLRKDDVVTDAKFYNAENALEELLKQFKRRGANLNTLRAKATGGASVLGGNIQTGLHNAESVMNSLIQNRIFIAAFDVGGSYGRSAKFESESGQLVVRIPQTKECKIY